MCFFVVQGDFIHMNDDAEPFSEKIVYYSLFLLKNKSQQEPLLYDRSRRVQGDYRFTPSLNASKFYKIVKFHISFFSPNSKRLPTLNSVLHPWIAFPTFSSTIISIQLWFEVYFGFQRLQFFWRTIYRQEVSLRHHYIW